LLSTGLEVKRKKGFTADNCRLYFSKAQLLFIHIQFKQCHIPIKEQQIMHLILVSIK